LERAFAGADLVQIGQMKWISWQDNKSPHLCGMDDVLAAGGPLSLQYEYIYCLLNFKDSVSAND
jgi:hypothetical protein